MGQFGFFKPLATSLGEGKSEFKQAVLGWKIDLLSHPAHVGGVG